MYQSLVAPGSPLGKGVKPSQRREMAKKSVAKHGISVRLACEVYGISETCYRYQATLDGENALVADWLLKLTQTHKRWGFGFLVSAQCEVLRLEPQACVPHIPGARIEPAH